MPFEERFIEGEGHRGLYAHVHFEEAGAVLPGLVIVPGGMGAGTDHDRPESVSAEELAALGFAVLHYDPSGRGRTDGPEDYWGPVHQRELAGAVDFLARHRCVRGRWIGILSFSIGITIAAGALARFPRPGVCFIFDVEGPSNRRNITLDDTLELLKPFPTTNDAFWREREAARFIGDIVCGYFRYQCEADHMQGAYKGHAVELLNNATQGRAAWTRCNDNPEGTVFGGEGADKHRWVAADADGKGEIFRYLRQVKGRCTR